MLLRKARAPSGAKMFEPSEYLTKKQIASFFGRLSAQRSKGKPLQIEDELEDQEPADDYQKELELQRSFFQMIDAVSTIDSSTFAKQPSSSNVPMDEAEVTQPIEEKEDTPTLPLNVKKIYGDGQCLFRSVVVACDNALLSCERNEGGWPKDVGLASHETKKADELRKRTIKMWKANKLVYQSHASDLELTHFWDDGHQDISERIAEMEKSDMYAGQPEISALVQVIKRPIAVHYMGTNKNTLFGEAYQESADTVHFLNYPDRGQNSPGHYDLLVSEVEEDRPTKLPKVGTYVII